MASPSSEILPKSSSETIFLLKAKSNADLSCFSLFIICSISIFWCLHNNLILKSGKGIYNFWLKFSQMVLKNENYLYYPYISIVVNEKGSRRHQKWNLSKTKKQL